MKVFDSRIPFGIMGLLLLTAFSAVAMGAPPPGIEDAHLPPVDLPVSKVVLFSTGLGYFQRTGMVESDTTASLIFRTKDINDLLKSMVLQDFDGGSITSVNYSSREPLAVTLRSLDVDLSGNPGFAGVIAQLRGEEIILSLADGRGTIHGSVVGIENRTGSDDTVRQMVNIFGEWGLSSIDMETIVSMRFADPALEAEFRRALELLAEGRSTDEKRVTFGFSGVGQRRILIGYLIETPVWKTSYRLVLGEDDEHLLQGWAIVENTTTEDWRDVKLTLVSGRPVSFQMDLYTPIYNPRPTIRVETQSSLALQRYEEPVRVSSKSAPPPAERSAMPSAAYESGFAEAGPGAGMDFDVELDISEGVDSAATTQRAGEFFLYVIDEPIDLPRGESAMVPIVDASISGERVSIYNPSSGFSNPYNGIRFTNDTGIDLSPGPITVFESDTYAGDSTIGSLPDGGERLISFSLDLGTNVTTAYRQIPEKLVGLSVLEGVLVTENLNRRETDYLLVGRGLRERKVLVEHSFLPGWKLVEPAEPDERTAGIYRFAVILPESSSPVGVEERLLVAEERIFERRTDLLYAGDEFIQAYVDAESVDGRLKASLRGILQRRQAIAESVADRSVQEGRRSVIYREQDRIRKNMVNLAEETDLYKRYVETLSNQEIELGELGNRIDALLVREQEQRAELERYTRAIHFE